MTTVRIKGFKIFKDRHGRMRCYHRETGQKIDLVKAPLGSAAFFTECEKITAIVRQEMDRIGGQEFCLPTLHPGEIWQRSGRWEAMGLEMFRLQDRRGADVGLAFDL